MSIQELITKTGLTQAEIAKRLGVHRHTILNWSKGDTKPSYAQYQQLLDLTKEAV